MLSQDQILLRSLTVPLMLDAELQTRTSSVTGNCMKLRFLPILELHGVHSEIRSHELVPPGWSGTNKRKSWDRLSAGWRWGRSFLTLVSFQTLPSLPVSNTHVTPMWHPCDHRLQSWTSRTRSAQMRPGSLRDFQLRVQQARSSEWWHEDSMTYQSTME